MIHVLYFQGRIADAARALRDWVLQTVKRGRELTIKAIELDKEEIMLERADQKHKNKLERAFFDILPSLFAKVWRFVVRTLLRFILQLFKLLVNIYLIQKSYHRAFLVKTDAIQAAVFERMRLIADEFGTIPHMGWVRHVWNALTTVRPP